MVSYLQPEALVDLLKGCANFRPACKRRRTSRLALFNFTVDVMVLALQAPSRQPCGPRCERRGNLCCCMINVVEALTAGIWTMVLLQDFAGGHIKGAIHLGSQQLLEDGAVDAFVQQLPADTKTIVVHCQLSQIRGPKCATRWALGLNSHVEC